MIPDKLKNDFNSLRNMFDELKREIDKNVVKEENYKGEFYEIAPYSYQRNRFVRQWSASLCNGTVRLFYWFLSKIPSSCSNPHIWLRGSFRYHP